MRSKGDRSLARLSAAGLSRLLEKRELSAVELVDDFLTRYEHVNPQINAIVAVDPQARARALESDARTAAGRRLGPLDGIPVTVKDNIFVAGLRATWGSRLYEAFHPAADDIGVARLRGAGANLLAKTNTPEFALAAHTDNLLFGPTRNPWNLELTPGGSSGGAVAALAAGLGPLAVGTDAGGSIRRPAAYAGVVGFRPSTGRIPRAVGFPAIAHDFQVIAPAARTVEDVYLLFRAMSGPDCRDHGSLAFRDAALPSRLVERVLPRSRIRCFFGVDGYPVDPQVRTHVAAAARTLSSLGHQVEEGLPPYGLAEVERIWSTVSSAGLARVVKGQAHWRDEVHPATMATVERGLQVTTADYIESLEATHRLRSAMASCFAKADFLLMPTSASLPWRLGEPYPPHIDGRDAGPRGAALFATFVNVAALPAVSIPVDAASDGIPIGMQLVAPFGEDLGLLRLAQEFEEAAPWSDRFPALG